MPNEWENVLQFMVKKKQSKNSKNDEVVATL